MNRASIGADQGRAGLLCPLLKWEIDRKGVRVCVCVSVCMTSVCVCVCECEAHKLWNQITERMYDPESFKCDVISFNSPPHRNPAQAS